MPPINTESTRRPGIKDLCSQLGYNEAKESPRHYSCLATPLRQFRSLNKAHDIPRCAFEFCERNEKNKHFFTSSREAQRNGWPILPDDKGRIIETITKIICIQDSNTRETERTTRNRNILSGLLNGDKSSKSNDYTYDHDGSSLESTTNVGPSKGTLVRVKREEAKLAEEAGLAVTQKEDESEGNTRSKTSEHLTWAYPEEQGLDHGYLPRDIGRYALAPNKRRRKTYAHSTSTSFSKRDDGEEASISCENSTEGVMVLDTTGVGSRGEFAAFINLSECNSFYGPPNRKTPAFNSSIIAEKTRDVSPNKTRCHVEGIPRRSSTTHIGKAGPIPLPPVSQCYGLFSFNTEGPNILESMTQSPGVTSHAVSKSASTDYQITSAVTLQEPPKIKLFLQNTDGEVDFQNTLPSREFKDATLPEFFAICSKRSSIDASMLKSLTFVVVFAHNLLLKVNQNDNEKKWFNIKRRISYLFKKTMVEKPQETEFEVWVVEDNDLAGL